MGTMNPVTLDLHGFELYQQVGDDSFCCRSSQKRRQLSALNCLSQKSISPEGKQRGLQATRHSLSWAAELEKAPPVLMMPR
jgi:hypothetical protein